MRGVALVLALLGASPAQAHHDAAVGRVGGAAVAMASSATGLAVPRLDVGAVWASRSFSRTLRGSDVFAGRDGGSVQVHQVAPTLAVELAGGTRVHASLPIGGVRVSGKSTALGLGDAQLGLTQRLGQRLQPQGDGPERARAAWLTVSATAPTGRYDRSTAVSLVDVQAGEGGDLVVRPYDTRASLGAGVFSAGVQLAGQVRRGTTVADGWLDASLPLHDTPDGIRWGADLAAGATARAGLGSDRVDVGIGGLATRHLADRLTWRDADSGELLPLSVGARSALRALLLASLRPSDRVRLHGRVRLPVYQHVQGTQLVETWSASLGVTVAVPVSAGR